MRRRGVILLAVTGGLAAAVYALTPPTLRFEPATPALPADLERHLADSERRASDAFGLIPGTEKRLRWFAGPARTPVAVVSLHGFSATRQEVAPAIERVADTLGANLFESRLTGHGRINMRLNGVAAEDWLDDAAEALAIGARLGDRVVLIGTSTGATLALAMASHPTFEPVSNVVMISPNFGPANERAAILTGPAGPVVARLFAGNTHSFTPLNEEQARYWTTKYPLAAAVEMMRLVDRAQAALPLRTGAGVLVLYSPNDRVVSPGAMETAYRQIESPRKQLIAFTEVGDPKNHVLAGAILSPESTDSVVAAIVDFVLGDGGDSGRGGQ